MRAIFFCGAVLSGLVLGAPAAAQDSALLSANLLGLEVPNRAGNDKASANFNGEVDLKGNRLCYYLDMDGVSGTATAHIHQKDQAGADTPTLALQAPGPGAEVCASADNAVLSAIAKKPDDYYIDVHTADYPDGAVRGTLKD